MTLADLMTARLIELADGGGDGFEWDAASARYRSKSTGRYVSEKRILDITERYSAEYLKPKLQDMTQRMIDGKMSLGDWQRSMAKEIKDAHIISATAGRGGRDQMTQSDWGRVGARLRFEYKHLNDFAQEVKDKGITGNTLNRAGMYGEAPRTAFYDGLTAAKKVAAFTEERRITNSKETCPDCIGYEAQGWQPIGVLPEPGQRSVCGHNCKCEKEYR